MNWLKNLLVPENKLRDVMELFPGKKREEVRNIVFYEIKKRLLPGGMVTVVCLFLAFLSGKKTPEEGILRPAPGKASATAQVQLYLESGWQRLVLPVGALEYEESEIEELHRNAENYLDEVVPGGNESFERVTEALYFPSVLPATGERITWSTDAPWLITAEGEVLNEDVTEAVAVGITAEISYGTECRSFYRVVMVCPPVYTEEEQILLAVQSELFALEEASRQEERFLLPKEILGHRLQLIEESGFRASAFWVLLAMVVPLLLYSSYFGTLDSRKKDRKTQAENCYTEFVTKLSLMLAAGISVRQVFLRLAGEYEKNHGAGHILSEELKVTKQELETGCSEAVAYENFGRRMGVLAYQRMASILTQNVSKGVHGIRELLLQEAKEVMAQDRADVRRKGEEAGTKLLLPMMGLLFLVFAILLVPAFQSF